MRAFYHTDPISNNIEAAKPGTRKIQAGFNWEEQWTKTKPVEKMKEILACDIGLYGKTDPKPDNLIFKPILSKDGPSETIYDKRFNRKGEMTVPQLVFSEDIDEPTTYQNVVSGSAATEEKKSSKEYYNELRGPIFRIRSEFSEVVLRFSKAAAELPHFIKSPSASTTLEEYFYDDNQHFSITTKCKDMRFIVLKNEGTTTIRYQWFRHPPNRDAQLMLAYTTEYKSLKLSKALDMDETQENVLEKDTSSDTQLKVPKKDHLEFHFSQLPGVLLPGQTYEFPIIFRSKKPGYFHETLYLLTHPRLNTEDGRYYAVSLTGVCTDIELAEKGNEKHDIEGLKRYLNEKISEEESIDLMDSILDRSLSEVTNSSSCSLPYGRVTAESIFYAHNRHYYYYCGKSEKALELVRQLIEMLVPKTRVENLAQCHLSIQSLYNLVTSARNKEDLYWSYLRTSQAEDLLEDLFDCMFTISKQRVFCWPDTDRRKYVACYTNMVVTFDEILLGFDRLYNYYNAPVMNFIDENTAKQLISEYNENEEIQEEILKQLGDEMGGGEVIEFNIDAPPLPTELIDESVPGMTDFSTILNAILEEEGMEGEAFLSFDEEEMSFENISQTDNDPTSDQNGVMLKKPKKKKTTVLTLEETMLKHVKDERRQVLTEARVKLFEDMLCDGIERMLSTVDCFNNMLDYRSSDSIVIIDDLC
ncbi:unnamed protein product [Orchesella dallaii]|uniref:MYCBP-associated protein n=1 Tax=Orchesella dallaii TaxID=48710 RepID=A0ABP1S5S5_9HEXA